MAPAPATSLGSSDLQALQLDVLQRSQELPALLHALRARLAAESSVGGVGSVGTPPASPQSPAHSGNGNARPPDSTQVRAPHPLPAQRSEPSLLWLLALLPLPRCSDLVVGSACWRRRGSGSRTPAPSAPPPPRSEPLSQPPVH